jgi:antitoxin ParD1/3/4
MTLSCDIFTPATREPPPMSTVEKRTVSLPADQARYIDELVASGGYASANEVVRAGLRALRERDAAVERWLHDEVVPVYDAMQADPGRALSADQVRTGLQAHHAACLKAGRRGA